MAAKCSIAPAVILNWIIEALSSFEEVDLSTLIGLAKMNTEILSDLGRDAREVISLRFLESLFVQSKEAIVEGGSAQNAKISFGVSSHCTKVLRHIVRKTPANLEKEKWDVHPFLVHKRSSLPECMLKRLKEAILKDSHPLLTSLKERSKLEITNTSENCDVQNAVAKDDIVFLNPRKDDNIYQEKVLPEADQVGNSTEGTTKHTGREECEMFIECPLVGSNGNKVMEHDDKRTDIDSNYEALLNSHLTLDQDFLAGIAFTEIDLCMKCNEGGQLLVCSSVACPILVHESCLGSAITLEKGKFFCPYCTYSRVISEYREAQRQATLAGKDLQAFTRFKVKQTLNKSTEKQSEWDKNDDRQIGAFDETTEGNGNQNAASRPKNINCMPNDEDSARVTSDDQSHGEKGVVVTVTSVENVGGECHSPTGPSFETVNDHGLKNPCLNGNENDLVTGEHTDMHIVSCSRNLSKRKAQHTPAVPLQRRKVVRWTKTEEETLKKAVQKYSSADYKEIPWKAILHFGCNVFHKRRTPVDLKDKWRNICKGSPNAK